MLQYYNPDQKPKNSAGAILYDQAYIYLLYLQNKFLIDRLATARGLSNEQSLLSTSMEMIEVSLMFWMKRDQLMSWCSNFDWIVSWSPPASSFLLRISLISHPFPCLRSEAYLERDNIPRNPVSWCNMCWAPENHDRAELCCVLTLRRHPENDFIHRLFGMGSSDGWQFSTSPEIKKSNQASFRLCSWNANERAQPEPIWSHGNRTLTAVFLSGVESGLH